MLSGGEAPSLQSWLEVHFRNSWQWTASTPKHENYRIPGESRPAAALRDENPREGNPSPPSDAALPPARGEGNRVGAAPGGWGYRTTFTFRAGRPSWPTQIDLAVET